jgi:hypothetical protein
MTQHHRHPGAAHARDPIEMLTPKPLQLPLAQPVRRDMLLLHPTAQMRQHPNLHRGRSRPIARLLQLGE